jgi:hypothetical protein
MWLRKATSPEAAMGAFFIEHLRISLSSRMDSEEVIGLLLFGFLVAALFAVNRHRALIDPAAAGIPPNSGTFGHCRGEARLRGLFARAGNLASFMEDLRFGLSYSRHARK